jgi:hypothetical protein
VFFKILETRSKYLLVYPVYNDEEEEDDVYLLSVVSWSLLATHGSTSKHCCTLYLYLLKLTLCCKHADLPCYWGRGYGCLYLDPIWEWVQCNEVSGLSRPARNVTCACWQPKRSPFYRQTLRPARDQPCSVKPCGQREITLITSNLVASERSPLSRQTLMPARKPLSNVKPCGQQEIILLTSNLVASESSPF